MNLILLNTESQAFINSHLDSDIGELILKGRSILDIDTKELVEQIEAKKRCLKKLPMWFNHQDIFYSNKLNIEQTSSEITADYKASLITGTNIIDLTGGFGVDCWAFSKRFESVTHCEINEDLSKIADHNFKQFGIKHIETVAADGISFLKTSKKTYDWIYVDPSRRHDSKGKVFFLNDCLPNIPNQLDTLFAHSKNVMIKTSPLLDLSVGIGELKFVKAIHIVAVNNEVKELLWILENGFNSAIEIETINIKSTKNESFKFNLDEESRNDAKFNLPLTYLYEPNAAILKAGAFNCLASRFSIFKLHKHSHLYTSETLLDFPGRRFKIEFILPYTKKILKRQNIQKANITTRNFPETVQQIRDSLKIKDGGMQYLFFTTNDVDEKICIICSKIS